MDKILCIFGWEKTVKPIRASIKTQCYHCSNTSHWSIWRETEWLSLLFIKVFPTANRYYIKCDICGDHTPLDAKYARAAIRGKKQNAKLRDILIKCIQRHQFSALTEGQIRYRRSKMSRQDEQ